MESEEVFKSVGLTKKAAVYYKEDIVRMFKEYLKDIEDNVCGTEKFDEILEKCKKSVYSVHPDVKLIVENMKYLTKVFNIHERQKKGCIKKELYRIFPGFFGKYIYLNFSEYLMEPVDTGERQNSWENIIQILDSIEYPDESEKIEEFIKKNDINWSVVEKFIENSRGRIGSENNVSIYDYPNILNNFQVTENDVNFCDELFSYMNSKNQMDYVNSLLSSIDGDLKIISQKYRNSQKNSGDIIQMENPDEIDKGKGVTNLPEMTFAAYEYKRFLPFGNMDNLIYRFKSKIEKLHNVINSKNIYVIKGIDSIPEYRKSKRGIFDFGFSFVVGVRVSNIENIPKDMKVFAIPAHKYAWYTSNGGTNIKDLIVEDLSTINFLDNKYKLSNFPMIQLYNEEYLGEKDGNLVFNSYIPVE